MAISLRPHELDAMLTLSGADGVMIGRGAYGRPWLPGAIAHVLLPTGDLVDVPKRAALAANSFSNTTTR